MLVVTKRASIIAAVILGTALSIPLSVPALSDPSSSSTAMPSQAAASFQRGDLVRLRSGGPAMTVHGINGNQVDCFWTGEDGQPNADKFPIDVLQKL
ncbi:DUF2158 domain-containing protein [Bradyrhizobium canariense]|nr:DUF2158 domain-containing protein [Bradyrhizobium canariense]